MVDRRGFLKWSAAALAGAPLVMAGQAAGAEQRNGQDLGPRVQPRGDGRVITPNGRSVQGEVVDGVRVFHLVAEPIEHSVVEGLNLQMWGFNGITPGPTLEATVGETVRIYVTNELPAPTSIHWHGIEVPNGMDGVNGMTQEAIEPGKTYVYEFDLPRPGTFMYHPHTDEMTQIGLGMMGAIIVHPEQPEPIDRDYVIHLAEFSVRSGRGRPDTTEMVDFDVLTMNSTIFPATEPLVAQLGELVRIRLINMSQMSHHPIHLHGHTFDITATEGGRIPSAGQWPETTVLVPTGAVREIEFVADNPGDWALHCHMLHHVMNQMGHPTPSAVGVDDDALQEVVHPVIPEFHAMGGTGMAGMVDHAPRFEETAYPSVEMPEVDPHEHHDHDDHDDHDDPHDHNDVEMEHEMELPQNSVAMKVTEGPMGPIEMGGMFTVVMVRDELPEDIEQLDWYDHPEGTVAREATGEELRRDGIETE